MIQILAALSVLTAGTGAWAGTWRDSIEPLVRAPTPPAYVNIAVMNGLPSSWLPFTCIVHTAPEPSAMAWSGLTWASAFRSALGRNIPTTWRAVPGCGSTALTMLPSGASTLIGARLPWLFGITHCEEIPTSEEEMNPSRSGNSVPCQR